MSLISPREAEVAILAEAELLPAEEIPLTEALGRVLREDLVADRAFPPFDRVTMDGIAFRAGDLSSRPKLTLQGTHAAGQPTPPPLKPGHCWQIMTGSVLPPDCDTIVPYEEVELSETTACPTGEIQPGAFIHREGSDASAGTLLLTSGTRLGPAHLGMMASIGAARIQVTRVPRLKILTTGDELIPVEETPLPHQLRQSNGLTLQSAVRAWGPAEVSWSHLPDDLEATTAGIAEALETSDLLLLSGGISKGRKDFVRPALESLCGAPLFHGVAQRPGKPLAFWNGILALPGNPNSTLTTFQRYVVPWLRKMTGQAEAEKRTFPLAEPVVPHDRLTQFLPAMLDGSGRARSLSPQNSGDFVTPLDGTGYLEIPPGSEPVTHALFF